MTRKVPKLRTTAPLRSGFLPCRTVVTTVRLAGSSRSFRQPAWTMASLATRTLRGPRPACARGVRLDYLGTLFPPLNELYDGENGTVRGKRRRNAIHWKPLAKSPERVLCIKDWMVCTRFCRRLAGKSRAHTTYLLPFAKTFPAGAACMESSWPLTTAGLKAAVVSGHDLSLIHI